MVDLGIRDRLTQCFLTFFTGLSAGEIPRASMATVGEWDSMASVTLIGLVSEEFGIEVAPDDYEQFVSYELILHYLETHPHVS
jgi:acyl carrier protein